MQQKLARICFSATRLKWEAIELVWLFAGLSEGSAPRHLHHSILLTSLLPHTAIETGFQSAVEAHSAQEQARERTGRAGWVVAIRKEKRRGTSQGETVGERVKDQERKSERHCHWWVRSCHSRFNQWFESDALSLFFPSSVFASFDDWSLWLSFSAADALGTGCTLSVCCGMCDDETNAVSHWEAETDAEQQWLRVC